MIGLVSKELTTPPRPRGPRPQSSIHWRYKIRPRIIAIATVSRVLRSALVERVSNEDNMSYVYYTHWADIYAKGNTGVFWDVVDFPIPECDPDMISKKIKSALEDKGCYNGPVSIRLYQDEKNIIEAAGISINFVPEVAEAYIHARVHKMLVDILLWALDNPAHSNLIILSKNLKDKETVSNLQGLHCSGMNVLLAEPVSKELPFTESSAWLWSRLCESLSSDGAGSSQIML